MEKWLDFVASVKLQGKVLDDLLAEGHTPIPTQWIDTEKKSRLVASRIDKGYALTRLHVIWKL